MEARILNKMVPGLIAEYALVWIIIESDLYRTDHIISLFLLRATNLACERVVCTCNAATKFRFKYVASYSDDSWRGMVADRSPTSKKALRLASAES